VAEASSEGKTTKNYDKSWIVADPDSGWGGHGAWLGGVVPYGYRKVGDKGQGRLVISEEPIPGFDLSEAEIMRTIYRMSATEKKSCMKIAD
jgi:hypothetical protein